MTTTHAHIPRHQLIHIPLFEEQQLKERFGEAYIEYCRHVPRLVPRLRSWTPTTSGDSR